MRDVGLIGVQSYPRPISLSLGGGGDPAARRLLPNSTTKPAADNSNRNTSARPSPGFPNRGIGEHADDAYGQHDGIQGSDENQRPQQAALGKRQPTKNRLNANGKAANQNPSHGHPQAEGEGNAAHPHGGDLRKRSEQKGLQK